MLKRLKEHQKNLKRVKGHHEGSLMWSMEAVQNSEEADLLVTGVPLIWCVLCEMFFIYCEMVTVE